MLRGLFHVDNPVMRFLSRVADVLILNLLFLICSIPVFTIGASLTAMYYCLFKIKEEEEGYLVKKFFHSFRQNFKQATLMWLIMLAVAVVLFLEFLMYRESPGTTGFVVRAIVLVGWIFWYLIGTYAFALQSKFYNSIKNTFSNAILLMFANGPRSVAILGLTAAIVCFSLMQKSTIVIWNLILLWILFGFAAIGTINVQFLYPVIRKLLPEEEKEETPSDYAFSVNEGADLSALGYSPAQNRTDGANPAEPEQDGTAQAESGQAGTVQSEPDQAAPDQADIAQAGSEPAAPEQAGTAQAESEQAGMVQSEPDQAG